MRALLVIITLLASAAFVCSLVSPTHQWTNDYPICEILYHKSDSGLSKREVETLQILETRLRLVESSQRRDWCIIRWISGASLVLGVVGLLYERKKREPKTAV